MKIWIFNHYATVMFAQNGGRHLWIARELEKLGHEVYVFGGSATHNLENEVQKDIFQVTEYGKVFQITVKTKDTGEGFISRIFNNLSFYKNLFPSAKGIEKKFGKPDVILASSVHPWTVLAGEKIAKKMNVPCIGEVRDLWPYMITENGIASEKHPFVLYLRRLEKRLYKNADAMIFTMEGAPDYIKERGWDKQYHNGKIDLNKLFHINNGIDLKAFNQDIIDSPYYDDDLDNKDIFKVVYTGSIRKGNDVEYILNVAEILKNKGENKIKFLLWGSGTELNQLIEEAKNRGLNNVSFKGQVQQKYIASILNKGNLNFIVMPNKTYRYGLDLNKLFSYLAGGSPILLIGYANYTVIEGYNCGKHFNNPDANEIANEIINYKNMPENDYKVQCENAKKLAVNYDFSIHAQKLIEVINYVKNKKEKN